jgi:hypothetical protein
MKLITEPYLTQVAHWPRYGRHILAQFDERSIVVYQAFRPTTGNFAATHGRFGHGFSLNRMSWIKPNFLWMMYRSGWGTKSGQEVTLAIRLQRSAFDTILQQAAHSTFVPQVYGTEECWQEAVSKSSVRLQWDPDHDPAGAKLERRAIQLGLRDEVLRQYAQKWILEIEDISQFVQEQGLHIHNPAQLVTPREEIYSVEDQQVAIRLGVTQP